MTFIEKIGKVIVTVFTLIATFAGGFGQELNVPSVKFVAASWKAQWITHPDLSGQEHAVVLFHRSIHGSFFKSFHAFFVLTDIGWTNGF